MWWGLWPYFAVIVILVVVLVISGIVVSRWK